MLKPGGVCLVISSQKGININPDCITFNEYEQLFWKKVEQYDDSIEKYSVCQYPMSEAELPKAMEENGFKNINVGYATIDLTPDNPKYSAALAHDMINSNRYTALDALESVLHTMPDRFTVDEVEKMKRLANAKYDTRIELYNRNKKQWDTNVSIIMVVRGVK